MALRGNLKELSLPDIFQLVTFSGKTGVLRIRREDGAQGSVWFREGDVFFAQSNWRTEPLGERLVRAQRITPMALERALELRAAEPEGGKRLGEILVEEGYITDEVLEVFVQEQIQDTIFDLMRWDDGDFEFEAMPEALEEDIGLTVSIENVIMEGSRRLEEWNRIKKKIPSTDIVFKMATAPGEGTFEISLKPIEWNLLLLVDGSRSVAELAVAINTTDFEVARVVYGLFSAGLLEFASDEEAVALRAERLEREAKQAELDKQRAAELEAEQAAAPHVAEEPEVTAPAQAQVAEAQVAEEQGAEESAEAAREATSGPAAAAEVPTFLGAEPQPATAEDIAALEAAMGAVLEHAPHEPAAPAEKKPAAPYTPGEEPAFIAASQEAQAGPDLSVPSVEELLGDLTELAPPAEEAPIELEAEVAPEEQPEAARQAPPEAAAPEASAEVAPEVPAEAPPEAAAPEVPAEAPPEVSAEETVLEAAAPEAAPEEIAEPEPATVHELAPELQSVAEALEEPSVTPEPAPPLEPGTFVIVPAAAESEGVPGEEEAVTEVEPLSSVVPEVVAAGEPEAVSPEAVSAAEAEAAFPETEAVPEPTAEASPVAPTAEAGQPGDFEHDLMALGLGEMPAELAESEEPTAPASEAPAEELQVVPETQAEAPGFEPVVEPMGIAGPSEEVAASQAAASVAGQEVGGEADFSALLESLDISADDAQNAGAAEAAPAPEAELNPLLEEPSEPTAGVISTDAYLDDLTLEKDFSFSGELTDELSALTGADRPVRPSASVRKLPAEGEALLRRDARVDRDTLMKIIDGIKSL